MPLKGVYMNEKIIVKAKHVYTIFHNSQNGYTVAKFVTYDSNEEDFTATGFFNELHEDIIYKLNGDYVEHPRFGMQFQVEAYEKMLPNDESSLIRYFSSSLFPGIGKKTAISIVAALGEDAIERIKEDNDVLLSITSLNERKRASVIQGILDHDELDDSVVFFTQHGFSVRNIMKIQAAYGEESVSVIKENPYRLVEELDGIGFKNADKLARELQFEELHPYRIRAVILSCVLDICMANGDTYTTLPSVQKRVKKEYALEIDCAAYLLELAHDRQVVLEEERIYHHTQYDAEKGIATFLCGFPYIQEEEERHFAIEEDMHKLEHFYHIQYDEKQKLAISTFFQESFSILTGGPGTGKTTIVQGILSLYKKYYPTYSIALCAPTGRAAKRLSELSNGNATTIHSLLKWDLESNTFLMNDREPIQADLLIIDEFSMVDQWVFYNLVKASKHIRKILIIGDEDQLPSVGPGCVLKDMIASKQFSVIRLEKIFRQSEGSEVVTLAHEMKEGKGSILEHAKDIAFFNCLNYEVKDILLTVIKNALDKGYNNRDIQVLAPMYGGIAGIDALNTALQKMMNPVSIYKREMKIGYRIFRVEDKVLQLKNQPEDEVYNGDIGIIKNIQYANENVNQKNCIEVDFDGNLVEYSGEHIYHITHAYCISIHKSQGSEYPIVIMPVVSDYRYMLQKRLLYTGVTRAKKSLVLLGDKNVFLHSLQIEEHHIRKSMLTQRILTLLE